jgi:hypothetical protein
VKEEKPFYRVVRDEEWWMKHNERLVREKENAKTEAQLQAEKVQRRHSPTLKNFTWTDWKWELAVAGIIFMFFFVRFWNMFYH